MVKLTFDEERVPLTVVEGRIVRVGKTRVALEGIIACYWEGYTPKEIQDAFDVISLGDVYSILGYYLHRQEEVDQYMRDREESWDRFVEELESQPGAKEFYARVREYRRQREMEKQGARGLESG